MRELKEPFIIKHALTIVPVVFVLLFGALAYFANSTETCVDKTYSEDCGNLSPSECRELICVRCNARCATQ